ncbi:MULTISPECIES: sugar phosphate isomerase/epimerase family protein [Salinibaculum]|uniref:sugar phosphate isomerase/epimerase family protein n=1 Tax=Salinibaculum TaxID=2732368 RepID=UPI0030CC76CD
MPSYVLWGGTVWSRSIEERLEAANAGGFGELSLFPTDVREAVDAGTSVADIRALAAEYGVEITILDPYTKWVPEWTPPNPDDVPPLYDVDETEYLSLCDDLGVESLTALERWGREFDPEVAATHFGQFCDRAADHDLRVHLEFIPSTGIPDLETAWDIVRRADRDNGGIVFDTRHYFRGTPDDDLLRAIPGEKIFRVQVCDAPETVQGTLRGDSRQRLFPGDGDLDLVGVLGILDDIGGLSSVGIEVISDEFDDRPATELGEKAGESLRDLLTEAGIETV